MSLALVLHINLDNTQLIISTDLSLATEIQPHYLLSLHYISSF